VTSAAPVRDDCPIVAAPPPSRPVCRADGVTWCWESPRPTGESYISLAGSGLDDLWALTASAALHFDGKAWSVTMIGGFYGATLWSAGRDDVWLAGGYPSENPAVARPSIWHWDGRAWTVSARAEIPDDIYWMNGIWGSGPSDIWATGEGSHGVLLHYDGARWTEARLGDLDPTPLLYAIGGTGPDDVWTSGARTADGEYWRFHFDGRAWQREILASDPRFYARKISGTAPDDVWLSGPNSLLHFDGASWTPMAVLAPPGGGGLSPLALGRADVWAYGASWFSTGTLHHFDGSSWKALTPPPADYLQEDLGSSGFVDMVGWSGKGVVAAGNRGRLAALGCDGTWRSVTARVTNADLLAVWALASDDLWAVGRGGVALHRDGNGWTPVATGTSADLQALWASGPHDVWAVGSSGTAIHWDGLRWTAHPTGIEDPLTAVSGSDPANVWAVANAMTASGSRVAALRFDGQSWSTARTSTDLREYEYGSVAVFAPDDVWVGGMHFDGHAWSYTRLSSSVLLSARAPDDIWAAVPLRWIYHYDGSDWMLVVTGQTRSQGTTLGYGPMITALSGSPDERPYFLTEEEVHDGSYIEKLGDDGVLRQLPKSYNRALYNGLSVRGHDVWLVGQGGTIEHGFWP
jgi:hypothetical protein